MLQVQVVHMEVVGIVPQAVVAVAAVREVVVAGAAAVEAAVAAEVVEAVDNNQEYDNICSQNQVCPPQFIIAMACD